MGSGYSSAGLAIGKARNEYLALVFAHRDSMDIPVTASDERLMAIKDLARHLQVSTKTIYNWRSARVGPPCVDMLGTPRYQRAEVDRWLAANSSGAA